MIYISLNICYNIVMKGIEKMARTKQIYDESKIQILQGLEAVRKRPGMYIGSTDSKGLHQLLWKLLIIRSMKFYPDMGIISK